MSVDTVTNFAAMLAKNHLLNPSQLEEISTLLQDRFPEPRALARELVQRGWLTPFQANKLFQERGEELLLGSYILLDRLGAGGMGEVYKARHAKLDKIVAVKLIRSDRLTDAETLRRFQREVRAAAQLNHPNIVHAFDCDEADGKHFLVLEYVEGIDLARLVKQEGSLPVAQACDCIRQAALGLQHAFERGLVHRDIKPHNLLLTRPSEGSSSSQAMVKILDLGLARLSGGGADSDSASTMTGLGTVMGTLDYLAPEQARDAHSADTRSDLYSLGCTFYFLLAGQVPFPGGSTTEKLLKHQTEQPLPLQKLRPDVPPAIAAIVSKLMAKRPEQRYQTPAEVAAILSHVHDLPPVVSQPVPAAPADEAMTETLPGWSSLATAEEEAEIVCHAEPRRTGERNNRKRLVLTAGVGLLALGGLLVFLWVRGDRSPPQTHPVIEQVRRKEKSPPSFDEWKLRVENLPVDQQIKAVIAKLRLHNPDFDGDVKSTIQENAVVGLAFSSDHVTDLRSLQALPKLQKLVCPASRMSESKLSDLSPLKGMELSVLNLFGNKRITDLSPLRGMPLTALYCRNTGVQDISPLRGMPLRMLSCPLAATKDHATLRSLKHLRQLNRRPIAEFWKNAGESEANANGTKGQDDGADEADPDP